uniref:Uncharacterized protein n=1 Tax=Megaviridae environmental sample TaxID=1737588 RepID=A0A5J6VK07_9VIRU|nr:MAG: hypothetical protein [Megaviridae environmental sample]
MFEGLNFIQKLIIVAPATLFWLVGLFLLITLKLVFNNCDKLGRVIGELKEDESCDKSDYEDYHMINSYGTIFGFVSLVVGVIIFALSYTLIKGLDK